jgi:predicted acyltransferase
MQTQPTRLLSLDVLRGLTIIGMIVVNATAGVYYSLKYEVFPTLLHVNWEGLHLADIVFPGFLFMMGVAVPLSLSAVKARGATGADLKKIGWRTVRIIALGLLVSNIWWLASLEGPFRPFGVLQRLGIVYGLCAITYLYFGWRIMAAIAAAILILYWPISVIPSPDGVATDLWQRGQNFVAWVDRAVAGDMNYVKGVHGYDPEGILGTLSAYAHGLLGVLTGLFLQSQTGRAAGAKLFVAGAVALIVGCAWGFVFPVVKDIWSSTFVLTTTGITLMALALLHVLLDKPGAKVNWTTAFPVAFGANAIAAYMLHQFTSHLLSGAMFRKPHDALLPVLGDQVAALVPIVIYLLILWAPLEYLRRKHWMIKV